MVSPGSENTFQRARRPEQREQRRQAILDAAEELLTVRPAAEVSLRELSRKLDWSKTNVVRYFETREGVFLELLNRLIRQWIDEFDQELEGAWSPAPVTLFDRRRLVTTVWARSLAGRPLLCELWSMLSAVLERNVSVDSIRAFKLAESEHRARLAGIVGTRLPELTPSATAQLVSASIVVVAGLWPFTNPAPAVIEATDHPQLAHSRVDFADRFGRILETLVTGFLNE